MGYFIFLNLIYFKFSKNFCCEYIYIVNPTLWLVALSRDRFTIAKYLAELSQYFIFQMHCWNFSYI